MYRDRNGAVSFFDHYMVTSGNPVQQPAIVFQQFFELLAGHTKIIQHIRCMSRKIKVSLSTITINIIDNNGIYCK